MSKYQGVHISRLDKFGAKGKRSVQNEVCDESCGGDARSEHDESQGQFGESRNRQIYADWPLKREGIFSESAFLLDRTVEFLDRTPPILYRLN